MRFFSRLNSWFGVRANQNAKPHPQDVSLPYEYLPNSTPAIFRQIFLEVLEEMVSEDKPRYFGLDPTIHLLAVPQPASQSAAERLQASEEIDGALNYIRSTGRKRSLLTWNSLKQSRPQFDCSYLTWAKDHVPFLHSGNLGLIFFVDIDAIAHATHLSVQSFGFPAQMSTNQLEIRVPERDFELRLSVMEIIAEAIWTGRGPLAIINKRSRTLAGDFRLLNSLLSSLRRRFPELQFEANPDAIQILNRPESPTINYREVARSIRHAEMSSAAWVESISIDDLMHLEGRPTLMLRSKRYVQAWPDALSSQQEDHATVAARLLENGRVRPVLRKEEDPKTRLQYYQDEAQRTFANYPFELHVHLIRFDETQWALIVLGDRAADLLLDRRFVRGVLEEIVTIPSCLDAIGLSEDFVVLCSNGLEEAHIEQARERGATLGEDIFDYQADPLHYRQQIHLPLHAAGIFHLTVVSASYFALRERASQQEQLMPGHAAHIRGRALRSLGQMEKAQSFFETALKTERNNADFLFSLGEIHLEGDHVQAALPLLEKAQLIDPESSRIAYALGQAHTTLGNAVAATSALEEALRLSPQDVAILVLLGQNYTENHLFSKARECLLRALSQAPNSTEAHATMATLCQRTGDKEGARTHAFAALLTQSSDSEHVNALKRLLNELDEVEDER